jgi:hypothetical protein
MLSPSGPEGIVEVSGATQAFEESEACGLGGAPKLTELGKKRIRTERARAQTNPHRMAIPRIMDFTPSGG